MEDEDFGCSRASGTRCIKQAFLADRGRLAGDVCVRPRPPCAMGCGAYGDERFDSLCKQCVPKLYVDRLARLRVDHLVYAAPGSLEEACADFEARTGVTPQVGGRHEGLGTHNALVSLGANRYFEILCRDPEQTDPARTWMAIDSITDTPRLVAWASLRADLDHAVLAAREAGYDPGTPQSFSRKTPSGSEMRWSLSYSHYTEPLPGDGAVPFLITWDSDSPARTAPTGCTLASLHAETNHPEKVGPMLEAIGIAPDEFLRRGDHRRLVAVLDTPNGRVEFS